MAVAVNCWAPGSDRVGPMGETCNEVSRALVAVKTAFIPTGTVRSGGEMVRPVSIAPVTVKVALAENPPVMAVMVVVPALRVTATLAIIAATAVTRELQAATAVRSRVLPLE